MRYSITRIMDKLRGLPDEFVIQSEGKAEYPAQLFSATDNSTEIKLSFSGGQSLGWTTSGNKFYAMRFRNSSSSYWKSE